MANILVKVFFTWDVWEYFNFFDQFPIDGMTTRGVVDTWWEVLSAIGLTKSHKRPYWAFFGPSKADQIRGVALTGVPMGSRRLGRTS